jgi:hydroxymethylglutaryl-CoA reductase (NADPH)
MVKVPSFLLKRLYVKGSLRNNEEGFQFELKNTLGSGYGNELMPLRLDGNDLPKENCYYVLDSVPVPFNSVSKEKPFTLPMNKVLNIQVKSTHLSDEPHKLRMSFVAEGIGELSFEVTDVPVKTNQ